MRRTFSEQKSLADFQSIVDLAQQIALISFRSQIKATPFS